MPDMTPDPSPPDAARSHVAIDALLARCRDVIDVLIAYDERCKENGCGPWISPHLVETFAVRVAAVERAVKMPSVPPDTPGEAAAWFAARFRERPSGWPHRELVSRGWKDDFDVEAWVDCPEVRALGMLGDRPEIYPGCPIQRWIIEPRSGAKGD